MPRWTRPGASIRKRKSSLCVQESCFLQWPVTTLPMPFTFHLSRSRRQFENRKERLSKIDSDRYVHPSSRIQLWLGWIYWLFVDIRIEPSSMHCVGGSKRDVCACITIQNLVSHMVRYWLSFLFSKRLRCLFVQLAKWEAYETRQSLIYYLVRRPNALMAMWSIQRHLFSTRLPFFLLPLSSCTSLTSGQGVMRYHCAHFVAGT